MRNRKLARRYAQALGELAHESNLLSEVEAELSSVLEMMGNDAFRRALESQNVRTDDKLKLVRSAFGERFSRLSLNFLLLVVTKRRETALGEMIEEFLEYADRIRGIVEVELTTAQAINQEQSNDITQGISKVLGKEVRLTTRENGELLGGVVARIGDLVMDGSVKTRLNLLGEQLKRAQLN